MQALLAAVQSCTAAVSAGDDGGGGSGGGGGVDAALAAIGDAAATLARTGSARNGGDEMQEEGPRPATARADDSEAEEDMNSGVHRAVAHVGGAGTIGALYSSLLCLCRISTVAEFSPEFFSMQGDGVISHLFERCVCACVHVCVCVCVCVMHTHTHTLSLSRSRPLFRWMQLSYTHAV